MDETITFSGQEAHALSEKDLLHGIDILKKNLPSRETMLDHVVENCSAEQLDRFPGKLTREGTGISVLHGFPVYKRKYVPVGEFWLIAQDGSVLEKIKVN